MKASEAKLLQFLRTAQQFAIPIYQRNYSWQAAQCQQLWSDLLRAGRDEAVSAHFIGAIVYVQRGLASVTDQEPLLVIDGQQRLTTATLLLSALADHFEDNQLPEVLQSFSARKLRNFYLTNADEEGERHYKLLLSETDRSTLLALVGRTPLPPKCSDRLVSNHRLFKEWIAAHSHEIEAICSGLAKLVIVDVSLDRTQDNPQLIFESMNSTGLELSQADLIRNYILMGLAPKLQTELYSAYWRPMEKGFGQAAYTAHFDAFMRHFLTAKTGDIPNTREVYTEFKRYVKDRAVDTRALVADIHAYAGYYCAMALSQETVPTLAQAFHDLRELKVDVAYPFLLDAYHDYRQGLLSAADLVRSVRLLESYVFRRAVCGIPTNSLNKTFAGLSRGLRKDRYIESLQAVLQLLPSYRRFPDDAEFQRELKIRDLYHFRSRSYWLRRLENHGRKEPVAIEDYTVEHILPQNEQLSPEWQAELGSEWQRVQRDWLHTLGNLTLTGYNSEYSDRPFSVKRSHAVDRQQQPIGLAFSPLRLNQGLAAVEVWNEGAIQARADRLAVQGCQVWSPPALDAKTLERYRPRRGMSVSGSYSMDDHPNLATGPVRVLFESLSEAVRALNPCVTEEVLKLYIAFKAETNFVDVVPQAKRLRLSLNLPFHEIDDPRGLCRDVSGVGRWGNGDVEVILSNPDDLTYVMGLIRQAFERQMDADVNDA